MNHSEIVTKTRSRRDVACNNTFRLYTRDLERVVRIRMMLEERTGRPASMTEVVLYLLDCYDRFVAIVPEESKP